jgi:hypothetical protein
MQYGNKLPSAYSELKIELLSVSNENKEKMGELNKNIGNQITTIEKTIEEVKTTIPTIPSDLNSKWETVKTNTSREIPTIPSDLNSKWETVKADASREIPTIPSDLNEEWETIKTNADKVPGIESKVVNLQAISFHQSLIDNAIMASPYGNLYDKITDGQKYPITIKTIVDGTIYPRTTNTIFTLYYSSYIDTLQAETYLLEYYTNSTTTYPVITI